eukprot:CAMPEP_0174372818 /NCGR_PEP_ID=MMETSP0811_2-20130205/104802_1 /TAXON_ID=73025 ORGANISM="Eutreptiella gymnastica-like, Strain CCMP1594" /NCGR_SAMPLE_ID=MMETSP0811_2 /ASSEMBLY_ACC=CAM_ASM_000667 /LENGTH=124 /DNA_ID=CAMNT_0015520535 /DNA_START=54 /DNA_END=425 /DNA_ORIENTATION=+
MVDATRKLLDELMGRNRNKENVREQNYWDQDVCKPYLLGCCYHTLWQHTKSDCGPCPYGTCQNERLKEVFEADDSSRQHRYRRRWMVELRDMLKAKVNDCDRNIDRAKETLAKRQAANQAAIEE